MKKNLPNIDKLFKAAIDNHEEVPSDKVWDALDRKLDKDKVIDFRKRYIHLKKIAIALLVLLLGVGVYAFITWKNRSELSSNNLKNNHSGASSTKTASKAVTPYTPATNKNNTTIVQKLSVLPAENKNKQKTVVASSSKSNNINAAVSMNDVKNNPNEITGKGIHKKVKSTARSLVNSTTSSASVNLVARKALNETGSNKSENGKVYTTKRKQKSVISNGSFEEENERHITISAMPGIQTIYPELLAINTTGNKKLFVPGNFTFPQNFPLTALVAKKTPAIKTGSFTLAGFFSPNLSSDFLKDDDDDRRPGRPDHDEDGSDIKRGEHRQSSSSFGLLLEYNFNRHWSLQSGVSLTNKTISINPKTIYAANDGNGGIKYRYNCSSGYALLAPKLAANPVAGDSLQAFNATNTLQYLAIPLIVKYNFSIKKFDLFTSVGISFNILTKGRLTTEIEGAPGNKEISTSTKIIGLKSGYLGGNIGFGASYYITHRVALTFMPSYNFALTSSTEGAVVKTYPNAISLAAGIIYKL